MVRTVTGASFSNSLQVSEPLLVSNVKYKPGARFCSAMEVSLLRLRFGCFPIRARVYRDLFRQHAQDDFFSGAFVVAFFAGAVPVFAGLPSGALAGTWPTRSTVTCLINTGVLGMSRALLPVGT